MSRKINGMIASRFLFSYAALALVSVSTYGLGLRVPDQGVAAMGRGNAFVATADNPSAIYYNPAGITQLEGHDLLFGSYNVTLESRYKSAATGNTFDTEDELHFVPHFYYTLSPEESPFSFGLGAYAPYGLSLDWGDDTEFRNIARDGELMYVTINPVVAWQMTPTLSIGGGPTLNFSKTRLSRGIDLFGARKFEFEGDDTTIGFNAGLLWQPHVKHSFGVSYRSRTSPHFRGESEINGIFEGDAHARLRLPQFIMAGYSFRPTPEWNIEFNIDWTDWDDLNTVTLHQEAAPDMGLVFDWKSSFIYELGVTRYFGEGWHVSGGYMFSENSVPERSFNPAIPDSDRHLVTVGVGRQYEHWSWDAAYQFGYGPWRTVSGSVSPAPPQSADGRYRFISHALAFSVGYSF